MKAEVGLTLLKPDPNNTLKFGFGMLLVKRNDLLCVGMCDFTGRNMEGLIESVFSLSGDYVWRRYKDKYHLRFRKEGEKVDVELIGRLFFPTTIKGINEAYDLYSGAWKENRCKRPEPITRASVVLIGRNQKIILQKMNDKIYIDTGYHLKTQISNFIPASYLENLS